jgi:membrane dipeptidase
VTIVHEAPTGWAVGWNEKNDSIDGLNDLGREMIAEMDRLGMIVYLSHSSAATMEAVLACANGPVIASHSPSKALASHGRNLTDDLAQKIAASGGVMGIGFISMFLSDDFEHASREFWRAHEAEEDALMRLFLTDKDEAAKATEWDRYRELLEESDRHVAAVRPTVETVVDHIDHFVDLVGADHVSLGSDFDGMTQPPLGLEDCTGLPNITRELFKRDYTEPDIRKILGGNFLRVFERVCG